VVAEIPQKEVNRLLERADSGQSWCNNGFFINCEAIFQTVERKIDSFIIQLTTTYALAHSCTVCVGKTLLSAPGFFVIPPEIVPLQVNGRDHAIYLKNPSQSHIHLKNN
jgi:hypothetical protein